MGRSVNALFPDSGAQRRLRIATNGRTPFSQSNWRQSKAANEGIPGAYIQYVTGVSERSQAMALIEKRKMNYHQYYPVDIVNGPGTRCTLFVSGCVHECPGCYNKSTWRLNSGMPFTAEMADRIIADLNDTRIKRQGISLSGGDPLHPQNVRRS
jgi:hypothetical protein